MLGSVITAGRRALDAAGGSVEAVALANQGETVLAWTPTRATALTCHRVAGQSITVDL